LRQSIETDTKIKFQVEIKEEKAEKMTKNDINEKNESKVTCSKWGLKAIQDDNKLRNSIQEEMLCFFTRGAEATKFMEEPSTFEQACCYEY
jgi:hypothetical protein